MTEFSLLSLNTFGLPLFLGWGRLSRLVRRLDNFPASILCFQEIQQNAYVPLLSRGLPDYPHQAYEMSWFAPLGGLFTASRAPMDNSQFIAYENRGRALSPGVADWALHKGVLVTKLHIQGHSVIVMNTHVHANYAGNWTPEHSMTQIQRDQVQHLAVLVNAQPRDAFVIVCGDFNFPRGTFLYHLLLEEGHLTDPLATDPRPTYRPFPLMPAAKWSLPIDFVLVRQPAATPARVQADIVQIEDPNGNMGYQRFLTDHNGLTLKITWD